ncbi:MAG: hypothetical protein LUQ61_02350, partial [Methanoregulaceae archaeon]|nr:hypothetical protein [Methanoregulaceae archaeon]
IESHMTKFYMKWQLNPLFTPSNPEERVKLWLSLLEMTKADLKSGSITDWGVCSDSSEGYAFAETDEKTMHASILKYIPYISFDIKPVIAVDHVIANIKQAAAAAKK